MTIEKKNAQLRRQIESLKQELKTAKLVRVMFGETD